MSPKFTIKSGKVTGRGHILSGRNCQDSLKTVSLTIKNETFLIGWISDGCSSGSHNEVGSNLGTEFLINQSELYLQEELPVEIIPLFLFEDLLQFLRTNLSSQSLKTPQKQAMYINDFLLFTTVGFIIGPKYGLIMAYGDGLVIINDEVYKREFDDESPYMGYLLTDPKYLSPTRRPIPNEFDIYSFKTADLKRLAIGSDVWLQEFELVSQIWRHKHPNQIQRNLNIWSDEGKLADDASLIVVESIP